MTEASEYGQFPLRQWLGMDMVGVAAAEPGTGSAMIDIDDRHANPNGVVHGAVLFAMVDTAMGEATMSVLEDGYYCASVEVQLRFIRPASAGSLRAEATVVKRGRSIVHLEARVTNDDKLVATAGGTFAVMTFDQ